MLLVGKPCLLFDWNLLIGDAEIRFRPYIVGTHAPTGSSFGSAIARLLCVWALVSAAFLLGQPAHASPMMKVAVSYFDNSTSDLRLNPLTKGLAEMMIADLGLSQDVTVTPRSEFDVLLKNAGFTGSPFKDEALARRMGTELGVQVIVVGAIIKQGGTFHLQGRLVNVADGQNLGQADVVGNELDIFTMENELCERLLLKLGARIGEPQKAILNESPTDNFEAYLFYCQGLEAMARGRKDLAKVAFSKAVAKEPAFVDARLRKEGKEPGPQGAAESKEGGDEATESTLSRLNTLAAQGDAGAQYLLGLAYAPRGIGEPGLWGARINSGTSMDWLRKSAEQGNHQAAWLAAGLAYKGTTKGQNYAEIKDLLMKSVANGSPCQAQYALGVLARDRMDFAAADRWLRQSIDGAVDSDFKPMSFLVPDENPPADWKELPLSTEVTKNWQVCEPWYFSSIIALARMQLDSRNSARSESDYENLLRLVYNDPRAPEGGGDRRTMLGDWYIQNNYRVSLYPYSAQGHSLYGKHSAAVSATLMLAEHHEKKALQDPSYFYKKDMGGQNPYTLQGANTLLSVADLDKTILYYGRLVELAESGERMGGLPRASQIKARLTEYHQMTTSARINSEASKAQANSQPAAAPARPLYAGGSVIAVKDPLILGDLTRNQIDPVIRSKNDALLLCYRQVLTDNASLAGEVEMRFVVAGNGAVSKAEVKESEIGSMQLGACLGDAFRGMQFPAPPSGSIVIVNYPLQFSR